MKTLPPRCLLVVSFPAPLSSPWQDFLCRRTASSNVSQPWRHQRRKGWPHAFCYGGLIKCHVWIFQRFTTEKSSACLTVWRKQTAGGRGRKCMSDVHGKVGREGLQQEEDHLDTTGRLKLAEKSLEDLSGGNVAPRGNEKFPWRQRCLK